MSELVRKEASSSGIVSTSHATGVIRSPYDIVRLALGVLLLVAALLKGYQLVIEPVAGDEPVAGRWILLLIVQAEFFLSLCLLANVLRFWTHRVTIAVFFTMALVTATKGLAGESSCPCFGAVLVSPWAAFAIDCTALVALLVFRPRTESNHAKSSISEPRPSWSASLALLVVGACFAGGFYLKTKRDISGFNAGLRVRPADLNLGDQWTSRALACTIPIHNTSNREVEVTDLRISCNCLTIAPRSFRVPPGGSIDLEVSVDLAARDPAEAQTPDRLFVALFQPEFAADTLPSVAKPWLLTARVRDAITAPQRVTFEEESLIEGDAFPSRTIAVEYHTDLSGVDVRCDGGIAKAVLRQSSGNVRRVELEITPNQTLTAGRHNGTIELLPITRFGEQLPAVPVQLVIPIANEVRSLPPTVSLGLIKSGAQGTATIHLASMKGRTFSIDNVAYDARAVRVEPAGASEDGERRFRVHVQPQREGAGIFVVTFDVVQHDGKRYPVPVTLSYIAETPIGEVFHAQ